MMKKAKVSFKDLINRFPKIELPVTLSEETLEQFSKHNKPLSEALIYEFLLEENEELDDLTEFIPCFRVPKTDNFHAIVYWKATLLHYQFIIATYSKDGTRIEKKSIAGLKSEGETITRLVATMDPDWLIYIAGGSMDAHGNNYEASATKSFCLELQPTGEVIINLNEK